MGDERNLRRPPGIRRAWDGLRGAGKGGGGHSDRPPSCPAVWVSMSSDPEKAPRVDSIIGTETNPLHRENLPTLRGDPPP